MARRGTPGPGAGVDATLSWAALDRRTRVVYQLMQLAIATVLSVLYVGIALAFGSIRTPGPALWFFVPVGVTVLAGLAAAAVSKRLPVPWSQERAHGLPPRGIHLSWRAAIRLPAWLPWWVFPWNALASLRLHFDIDAALAGVAVLFTVSAALVVRKRRREVRLLREGELSWALVVRRVVNTEGYDDITYQFMTADGTTVTGVAIDAGYDVREGASVPVFYDASDPEHHVIATACWFEPD